MNKIMDTVLNIGASISGAYALMSLIDGKLEVAVGSLLLSLVCTHLLLLNTRKLTGSAK